MTQNNPAFDIRDLLINVDSVSTPIYVGQEPASPDTCLTIYNTSFDAPSPKFLLDNAGLQIRSRSASYNTAYSNLLAVFDLLVGRSAFTRNTTRYTGVLAATNIFELGKDSNERTLLAVNLRMFVEPASGSQHRQSI